MGRKKIEIEKINDDRIRRVTFKKRRIGLLKKAIQLSKLTDAKVMLKVYNNEDESLIEYFSQNENEFQDLHKGSEQVFEYSKFFNRHYNLVARIEEKVTSHGNANSAEDDVAFDKDLEQEIEGINMIQLFSLAKRTFTNQNSRPGQTIAKPAK